MLPPGATVTLGGERAATDVDEVLASLDRELVGLLPVLRMADLLHRLGYLEKGHLVHAMRDDLVGEFIGHTAPKTKRVLDRAMGGVLFIDEAYYLYRSSDSKDYGQECIDILLQVMENDRDKLVVILAGYTDRMDEFFAAAATGLAHHDPL